MGLIALPTGLKQVDRAREHKKWTKNATIWCDKALVSPATLKRFWRQIQINEENFYNICYACGFSHQSISQTIVDWEKSTTPQESIKSFHLQSDFPPFGDRGCILESSRFFPRKILFKTLYKYLKLGWSCALIGKSGSGKSSILNELCRKGHKYLSLPSKNFIYFDLGLEHRPHYFLKALGQSLGIDLKDSMSGFDIQTQLVNQHFIICLDEIHQFTLLKPSEMYGILNFLRALAEHHCLTLVTASHIPLEQIFLEPFSSPFADIFYPFQVNPFTPQEIRDFLNARLQNTQICFSQEQIEQLIKNSQGHPATLQKQALALYNCLLPFPK